MPRSLLKSPLLLCALSLLAVTAAGADTRNTNGKSPAGASMRLAVGYCSDRCYQQFTYCQYRDEPHERCVRRLTRCLANC